MATASGRVDFVESLVASNVAMVDGGGVATTNGRITLTNSTVSGNSASERGGGVHSDRAAVQLVNTTMTLNSAAREGGEIKTLLPPHLTFSVPPTPPTCKSLRASSATTRIRD